MDEFEIMMENMQEDAELAQDYPCCFNCLYCYMEYGQILCKYQGDGLICDSEEWKPAIDRCERWRNEITGMPV